MQPFTDVLVDLDARGTYLDLVLGEDENTDTLRDEFGVIAGLTRRRQFRREGRHFRQTIRKIPHKNHRGPNRKESRLNPCYENVTKKFTFMVVLLDTVV